MLVNNIKFDDIDRKIVEMVQSDPNVTHCEIAEKIHRSQPTVGLRIKKLEDLGVLEYQAGVNLKKSDIFFASVNIQTNFPDELVDLINECPHILFAFRLSGMNNFQIIIAAIKINARVIVSRWKGRRIEPAIQTR